MSRGTQANRIFQVSLRDPRASEGILVASEALCTPRVGSGLFPQESALQAGRLAESGTLQTPRAWSQQRDWRSLGGGSRERIPARGVPGSNRCQVTPLRSRRTG